MRCRAFKSAPHTPATHMHKFTDRNYTHRTHIHVRTDAHTHVRTHKFHTAYTSTARTKRRNCTHHTHAWSHHTSAQVLKGGQIVEEVSLSGRDRYLFLCYYLYHSGNRQRESGLVAAHTEGLSTRLSTRLNTSNRHNSTN